MKRTPPKVLIFTPIYEQKDYALPQFLEHTSKLTYPNYRHIFIDNSENIHYYLNLVSKGLDTFHVDRGNSSREALARSQNLARKMALDEGYDYVLSLESDVMVPPNIVERLLLDCKDVVSALYFIGDRSKGERVPCLTLPELKQGYGYYGTRILQPEEYAEYVHKGLKRVQAAGMGCCLIHKSVLQKIPFMYEIGLRGHSDIFFFNDCFRLKVPVWVDTDVVCDHQNSKWSDVKDR